jgi:hypothetical protein
MRESALGCWRGPSHALAVKEQLSVGDPGRETRFQSAQRILEPLPPARDGCGEVHACRPTLQAWLGMRGAGAQRHGRGRGEGENEVEVEVGGEVAVKVKARARGMPSTALSTTCATLPFPARLASSAPIPQPAHSYKVAHVTPLPCSSGWPAFFFCFCALLHFYFLIAAGLTTLPTRIHVHPPRYPSTYRYRYRHRHRHQAHPMPSRPLGAPSVIVACNQRHTQSSTIAMTFLRGMWGSMALPPVWASVPKTKVRPLCSLYTEHTGQVFMSNSVFSPTPPVALPTVVSITPSASYSCHPTLDSSPESPPPLVRPS